MCPGQGLRAALHHGAEMDAFASEGNQADTKVDVVSRKRRNLTQT